jgi:hypothetical protein
MKKFFAIVMAAAMLLSVSGVAMAGTQGSGAPPGAHETINIIGVPHGMNDNFSGGEGSRIFVDREAPTTFYVYGSNTTGFEIKDHDGTDGEVGTAGRGEANAGIILPYNSATGRWQVEIYVKLLGPMDSSVRWTSYYFDGSGWALIAQFTMTRADKKFQLRTDSLLENGFQDVLWYLDQKDNFKHLQMRIYLHPEY